MSTIVKTTYTFTALHRADWTPEGIEDAMRESYDGHAVGQETSSKTEPVPDDKVSDELVALSNDGSFFDEDLQEES